MELKKINDTVNFIKSKTKFKPKIAVVLGSGLGSFADDIDIEKTLDYSDIPFFPQSTVQGHKGRFVFGYIKNIPLVIMQGRFHNYEGYPPGQIVLPIRVMKLLGAEILILTNASGGISFKAGTLMVIKDHISNFAPNPLLGKNIEELGVRFPDMSNVYDKNLIDIIYNSAKKNNIEINSGVYIQLTGPSYEAPAEIRMCKTLGADAVGMSTVQEAIAARHIGFKVCGISLITNAAANETPI
ncbi:methylthioadenosine/purine nucleoside phosphorylase [Holotrichia oblita]|nr:methylthioadenosine/purine nucleoside phosphorylase [Holotrichia oblita]